MVFVESYGRVAVQGKTTFSPGSVGAVLDEGDRRLRAAGWGARSAFLTSPTFGAASWLAHSTLQSGLWVDSQRRYEQLLGANRLTLTSAFEKAGWRTVFDVPANTRDWPEGESVLPASTQLYDPHATSATRGRSSAMPPCPTSTRWTPSAGTSSPTPPGPVMGEIDLVSSHHPWAPSPLLVPWAEVGDGSVFDDAPTPARVVRRAHDALRTVHRVHDGDPGLLARASHPDPTWCCSCSATTSRTPTHRARPRATTCRCR